jgi:glucosylceramidase
MPQYRILWSFARKLIAGTSSLLILGAMMIPLNVQHGLHSHKVGLQAASGVPGLSWSSGGAGQYAFPGVAGMSDQTVNSSYTIENSSNVTITILDAGGNVVRTLQTFVSEVGCLENDNDSCVYSLNWDGTNGNGDVVAPGQYTIQVTAANSAATQSINELVDVANPGAPGTLTSPTNGATVSGTSTNVVFSPSSAFSAAGFTITQVSVSCTPYGYVTVTSPAADDTWQGSLDTTNCANGSNTLSDSVDFTDPLGNSQSWSDPNPPSVTVSNPPDPSWYSGGTEQYLFPGVAGMSSQTMGSEYTIGNTADVTITVLDSHGTVVKTLQTSTQETGCLENDNDSCVYSLNWDGTNGNGDVVAPGQYTIQVKASNSVGGQTINVLVEVANPGAPGTLENPAAESTLEGLVYFEFDPSHTFPWGSRVTQVDACLSDGPCAPMYNTSPDGNWWTTELMTGLTAGKATLSTTVDYTDPLGQQQSWSDSGRTVFVNTRAVPPPGTVWIHETNGTCSVPLRCDRMWPTTSKLSSAKSGNIVINLKQKNQTIDGFGAMLTDSSARELTSLPQADLDKLMSNLFSAAGGAGITVLRIPIGPNDFSPSEFSYQSSSTATFNLFADPDGKHILQVLKLAREINPNLVIIASPWSAPSWMKVKGASYNDGSASLTNYKAYEQYLVTFLKQYRTQGIPIQYITPQNEPGANPTHYPGMNLSSSGEKKLIAGLAPLLTAGHLATKVLAYDWNWDKASNWGLSSVVSAKSSVLAGTAWHCYDNAASPTAMGNFLHYPKMIDFITECSGYGSTSKAHPDENSVDAADFKGNLNWDSKNLITGGIDNWASGVMLYNLALNDQCGPQLDHGTKCVSAPGGTGCGNCRGVVTIGGSSGSGSSVYDNVEYWLLSQASAAFIPGAHEVTIPNLSGLAKKNLYVAAAVNPDGTVGLYVSNQSSKSQSISVDAAGEGFTFSVDANSVASFGWLESS